MFYTPPKTVSTKVCNTASRHKRRNSIAPRVKPAIAPMSFKPSMASLSRFSRQFPLSFEEADTSAAHRIENNVFNPDLVEYGDVGNTYDSFYNGSDFQVLTAQSYIRVKGDIRKSLDQNYFTFGQLGEDTAPQSAEPKELQQIKAVRGLITDFSNQQKYARIEFLDYKDEAIGYIGDEERESLDQMNMVIRGRMQTTVLDLKFNEQIVGIKVNYNRKNICSI